MDSGLVYDVSSDTLPSILDGDVRERMMEREAAFWDNFRRQVSVEYEAAFDAALSEPYEPSETLARMMKDALSYFGGYRYAEYVRARLVFSRMTN